jgi:hypothetical protein
MAVGKKITDLTASESLKDTDLAIVHDGNGTKKSTLTQLSEYIGTKFSNPNLLINPDFKINQRGKTSYEVTGFDYTVDRWRVSSSNVAVSENGGLTIHSSGSAGSWFTQKLEKELEGIATLSIKVSSINGRISLSSPSNNLFITSPGVYSITLSDITEFNMYLDPNTSVTIEWTKLEKGSIATPFIAPNPTEELMKCKRFFYKSPKTLIAYGIDDNIYIKSTEVMNMRGSGTVVIENTSAENYIRYEGNKKTILLDVKNFAISITDGYIRIALKNNNLTNSKFVALDLNSVLTIDAEVY